MKTAGQVHLAGRRRFEGDISPRQPAEVSVSRISPCPCPLSACRSATWPAERPRLYAGRRRPNQSGVQKNRSILEAGLEPLQPRRFEAGHR